MLFLGVSYIIGALCYLWKLSKKDFHKGFRYLDNKIEFGEFMEKHFFN